MSAPFKKRAANKITLQPAGSLRRIKLVVCRRQQQVAKASKILAAAYSSFRPEAVCGKTMLVVVMMVKTLLWQKIVSM